MKVKKLLTFLVASSMLAACGTKTSKPVNSGSDAPVSASNNVSNISGSSVDASSVAPVTLSSISVTAPTKTAYTTDDTQLDLTGMVITARFSDGTTQTITEGYTIGNVDFTTAGEKTVVVTYQGKTDSFTITVDVVAPTDWDAELKAEFQAALYGYAPAFFYGPNYGFGSLDWDKNADGDTFYAEGSETVPAAAEGQDSPVKPIADLLIADGFAAKVTPNVANEIYHYELEKAVTANSQQRFIQARITLCDSEGYFAESGKFYFEISDAYAYSFEESGINAAVKEAFEFTEDLPTLPNGARYLKREVRSVARMAANVGYAEFSAYNADTKFAQTFLNGMKNSEWLFSQSSRDGIAYDAISPLLKIRLGISYSSADKKLTIKVDRPDPMPSYLNTVAELLGVPGKGYGLIVDSQSGDYFYDFPETLGTGETYGDLVDKYAAMLLANPDYAFAKKGDRVTQSTYAYDVYVSSVVGARVQIVGLTSSKGDVLVEVIIYEYIATPSEFLPVFALLGINEENTTTVNNDGSIYTFTQIRSASSVAYADALKAVTDILDNDTTLNFHAITDLSEGQIGEERYPGLSIDYANDNVKIEFLAWNDGTNTIVQPVFYRYKPAPVSEWADKVIAALASKYRLAWDSDGEVYEYANYCSLAEGETSADFVDAISDLVLGNEDLHFQVLSTNYTAAESKVVLISYENEGALDIKFSTNYGDKPVVFINLRIFDENVDPIINATGAVMGVNLVEVEEGVYQAQGRYAFTNTFPLAGNGYGLLTKYVAEDLIGCTALGFQLGGQGSYGMDGNDYVGYFANSRGYTAEVRLLGDENKNYTGNYVVTVMLPQQA